MRWEVGLAAILSALYATVAFANGAYYQGVRLTDSAFKKQKLPQSRSLDEVMAQQDYDDDIPRVFTIDLNGDRVKDYIIISNSTVCGTGGCVYTAVDGKTLSAIGEFFGVDPIIATTKVNNHALIMFWKYSAPDEASLEVWAFDKKKYTYQRSIKFKGQSLEKQERQFKAM